MKDTRHAATRIGDAGFSLIELVIAALLLGLLAIGALPLLARSVQASTNNRSLVAATAFANASLAGLRAEFGNDRTDASCIDLTKAVIAINAGDLEKHPNHPEAPAGSGLAAELGGPRLPGQTALPPLDCTPGGAGPVAVPVTVEVFPGDDRARVLVSLSTQILVGAP